MFKLNTISSNNKESNDVDIWTRFKTGDEAALGLLIKTYYKTLKNYGFKFSNDENLVTECVQDVFIEIWQKKEKLVVPTCVKAYLLRSVRNRVIRIKSRSKEYIFNKEEVLENNSMFSESSFEDKLIEKENSSQIKNKLQKIFKELPKKQYELIYLYYYQNLSRNEIANIMNITEQSVSNLMQRAFKTIKSAANYRQS